MMGWVYTEAWGLVEVDSVILDLFGSNQFTLGPWTKLFF